MAQGGADERRTGGPTSADSRRILVLDDDPDQAELMAAALASPGWIVEPFTDPIRALATLNAEGADLLIADLSMPWIDGGDVVANARTRYPTLPVILVSGFTRGATLAERYHIPFFSKPVDPVRLRSAVAHALQTDDSRRR